MSLLFRNTNHLSSNAIIRETDVSVWWPEAKLTLPGYDRSGDRPEGHPISDSISNRRGSGRTAASLVCAMHQKRHQDPPSERALARDAFHTRDREPHQHSSEQSRLRDVH